MKNRYNIKPFPQTVEYMMFSQMTTEDVLNNPITVLVRLETKKSISMSLYVNGKCNTINKKYFDDVKYLERSGFSFATGERYTHNHIKILKKQSGDALVEIIKRHIDRVLPETENGLEVDICFRHDVRPHL